MATGLAFAAGPAWEGEEEREGGGDNTSNPHLHRDNTSNRG